MPTPKLDQSGAERAGLSLIDDVGRVVFWNGKILRTINPGKISGIRELLDSGLIDELTQKQLFPKTSIASVEFADFPFVLEHERLNNVTYPFEWSFSMFRDAALLVLRVNKIANRYGYELKDCHGLNIIFDNSGPMYVDLGSFIKRTDPSIGWIAYDEFVRYYIYTLKIWKTGNEFLARRLLVDTFSIVTHLSFGLYKNPLLRWLPAPVTEKLVWYIGKANKISMVPDSRIRARIPGAVGKAICALKSSRILPFSQPSAEHLERTVQRITKKKTRSIWGEYHKNLFDAKPITTRFSRIIEIISGLERASVLELAGNQGVLSVEISKLPGISSVICSDYDENAIDKLYEKGKASNSGVTPALFNFICPLQHPHGKPTHERVKADIVLALAVTHHLLLTQQFELNNILSTIGEYSKEYVLIEFMPLGLYDGVNETPPTPEWYNIDWFRSAFNKHFKIIHEESLEVNRVLFVGAKR